jgi:3-hydroxyacyl-[acyl-carrier-protein] dehydratase
MASLTSMNLTLPLDQAAVERILPHRFPFLLVDRIIDLEIDKRIVGIKNVSLNDRYLSHPTAGAPALPTTILTEAIAQVGAILMLVKPENRERLPLFRGIQRVRYRGAVRPGDVVVIEVVLLRLRRRMAAFRGIARVDNRIVLEGTMTCALVSAEDARATSDGTD